MATVVQLELRVDEKGAVQGVRAFDSSIKGASASTDKLDATLIRMNALLDQLAQKRLPNPFKEHEKGATSSLHEMHLLEEEVGIRLPRAFARLAAESKIAQTILSSLGGAMMGFGAIQIGGMVFEQMYEGAHKVWENYISITKAAEDYRKEVEKTRAEDFGNTRSIEDTRLRIQQATGAARDFAQAASEVSSSGWKEILSGAMSGNTGAIAQGVGHLRLAHSLAGMSVQGQRDKDKLDPHAVEQQHELAVEQIEYNHALDGTLGRLGQIDVRRRMEHERNAENRSYENQLDRAKGNPVAPDSGAQKERLENAKADKEAWAETYQFRKQAAQELLHMREAAVEAGLRGSKLYHAQEAAAIADLKYKDIDRAQATAAIRLKFHNEEVRRLHDEQRATEEMRGQAALASFNGIGRVQAQGTLEIAKVNGDDNLSDAAKADRVAAIQMRVNAEMLTAEHEFTGQVDALVDERTEHQLAGFRRIDAEAQREINRRKQEFLKQYGQTDQSTPEGKAVYQQGLTDFNRATGSISAGAGVEKFELQQRNADETAQIEMEARARSLSAEKQQTLAIQAEYESRVRKYADELRKEEISQNDYNRRVLAAEQLRNAQMVEAARAAREKMAGEFSHFFRNPSEALKDLGDKAAGEAAAAMVQRVQNRYGSGDQGKSTGSIFDRIAGYRDHQTQLETKGRGTPASAEAFHLGTAQIFIASGSIVLPGGTTSAVNGASGFGLSSGSAFSGFGQSNTSSETTSVGTGAGFSAGSASVMPVSSAGETSAIPGSGVGGAISNVSSGLSLGRQAMTLFGGRTGAGSNQLASGANDLAETKSLDLGEISNGTSNLDFGKWGQSTKNNGMLGGGGFKSNAMGAAGGAAGLYSAYESNGGVGGALSGAMSGMQLGLSVGGPMGAAIGLAAGAVMGAIGFGGREKARVYDLKQVRPRVAGDEQEYESGSMDYLSAYSDMQALTVEADKYTRSLGPGARSYFGDTIKPELTQAEGKFTSMEKSGRSQYGMSAAQFDVGTDSVPRDGWSVIHQHERIMPSNQNERITRAVERSASMEAVAANYRATMSSASARQSASSLAWSGDVNIKAIDTQGIKKFFDDSKHFVRSAYNQSLAENSGGADAGF